MNQFSENEIAFFKQLLLDFDVRIDGRNKMDIRKYSIEKKNTEELSKLDLRDEIERILNEHSDDYKNVD